MYLCLLSIKKKERYIFRDWRPQFFAGLKHPHIRKYVIFLLMLSFKFKDDC
jgi:hypothetical protein